MTHFLNANDLAEACSLLGLADAEQALVEAAQKAGEAIAEKLGIELISDADNQPGFAGLCAGFGPIEDGEPCPDEIHEFDPGSEWAEETARAAA